MIHKSFTLVTVLVIAGVVGCSDPAKPHLERLVNDMGVATATGYTHSDDYSRDEYRVHYFHESSAAHSKVLAKFLADDPPVSDELKQLLRAWKTVNDENAALHAKMIAENRFVYTETEQARADTLKKLDIAGFIDFMEHLEGY